LIDEKFTVKSLEHPPTLEINNKKFKKNLLIKNLKTRFSKKII